MPQITNASKTSDTVLDITCQACFTSGYTVVASFMGVNATTTVVNSATSITATWSGGVPLTSV